MRSSDPDFHHARPLRTGHHAPGEKGIHLMGDTTSAEVGTGPATLAYLRTALGLDDGAWPAARGALVATGDPLGRMDSQ
jgi:hypothetical protein